MDLKELGKSGETTAAQYLEEKGLRIIEKNFRNRMGEVDLIAFDPKQQEWVFAEVKTRRNSAFGYPEEAVNHRKMRTIEKIALAWLKMKGRHEAQWRVDVISIEIRNGLKKITHLTHQS